MAHSVVRERRKVDSPLPVQPLTLSAL